MVLFLLGILLGAGLSRYLTKGRYDPEAVMGRLEKQMDSLSTLASEPDHDGDRQGRAQRRRVEAGRLLNAILDYHYPRESRTEKLYTYVSEHYFVEE